MRKLAGLDLDGWRDLAVRDTPLDGGDEDPTQSITASSRYLIDGGIGGVVTQCDDESNEQTIELVGGPQALASAIGRGDGWGEIGRPKRRKSVKSLLFELLTEKLTTESKTGKLLGAAAAALTAQTDEIIATIPDYPEIDEDRQEKLLNAFRRRGIKVTLLWHPVAVILDALSQRILTVAQVGKPVLIVRHVTNGFDLQTLTLRCLKSHSGSLAPERAEVGRSVVAPCGLAGLLAQSEAVVRAANPDFEFERHDDSRLPMRLLLDDVEPDRPEILRALNGRWSAAKAAPREALRPDFVLPTVDWGAAKTLLLTTPIAAPYRDALRAKLSAVTGMNVILMPLESAAHGALLAGRRIESGIPHYLDRLEQVSLLVLRNGEVVPEDLVPANAVVVANREFVAKPVSGFAWPALQRTMEFYLQKGGLFKKWTTTDVPPSDKPYPVEVQLRQMPAQGRARVSITSDDWDALRLHPVHLEWSALEPVDKSFEEIAEILRPRPVVPDRVTARMHLAHWKGAEQIPSFEAFISRCNLRSPDDLVELGKALRRQTALPIDSPLVGEPIFSPTRLLDFDGNAPEGADPEAVAALDHALATISTDILRRCSSKEGVPNNHLVTAATWSFGRCPDEVQEEVFRAVDAHFSTRFHPLLKPRGGSRVLIHGLGRIVNSPQRLERAIDLLTKNNLTGNSLAALASMLSRPAVTPQVLTEERCSRIAFLAEKLLADLERKASYGNNLTYAMTLVGGLLRCREVRPQAMVATSSLEASGLLGALNKLLRGIELNRKRIQRADKRLELIGELLKLLEGTGGNAGILVDLEALEKIESDDPDGAGNSAADA